MPKTVTTESKFGDLSLQSLETQIDHVRDELSLLGSLLDCSARNSHLQDWAFTASNVGALSASLLRLSETLDEVRDDVANASPETVRR